MSIKKETYCLMSNRTESQKIMHIVNPDQFVQNRNPLKILGPNLGCFCCVDSISFANGLRV